MVTARASSRFPQPEVGAVDGLFHVVSSVPLFNTSPGPLAVHSLASSQLRPPGTEYFECSELVGPEPRPASGEARVYEMKEVLH